MLHPFSILDLAFVLSYPFQIHACLHGHFLYMHDHAMHDYCFWSILICMLMIITFVHALFTSVYRYRSSGRETYPKCAPVRKVAKQAQQLGVQKQGMVYQEYVGCN